MKNKLFIAISVTIEKRKRMVFAYHDNGTIEKLLISQFEITISLNIT